MHADIELVIFCLLKDIVLFYFILQNSPYIRITITQRNLHTLNKCHTHNGWNDTIFAVDQIKTTVEDAYSSQQVSSSPVNPECCKINPTKTDYRFKTEVFNDKFCEIRAQYIVKPI